MNIDKIQQSSGKTTTWPQLAKKRGMFAEIGPGLVMKARLQASLQLMNISASMWLAS